MAQQTNDRRATTSCGPYVLVVDVVHDLPAVVFPSEVTIAGVQRKVLGADVLPLVSVPPELHAAFHCGTFEEFRDKMSRAYGSGLPNDALIMVLTVE